MVPLGFFLWSQGCGVGCSRVTLWGGDGEASQDHRYVALWQVTIQNDVSFLKKGDLFKHLPILVHDWAISNLPAVHHGPFTW